jgi:hypothetical protein
MFRKSTGRRGMSLEDRPVEQPHAAGVDIGAREIFVAVPHDPEGQPVRKFATFTEDLCRLADWLQGCGVTTVAMESTGVFWIPLYELLEQRGLKPKTSPQQPMLQQIGDPLAVFLIRLPSGHCFDVLRIHQQHLKLSFQKVPHRLPIHSRGLHRYMGYSTGAQPIAQLQQLSREGSERPRLSPPPGGPQHTRRYTLLVNIQTATDFMYNFHRQTPSAA